VKDCCFRLGRGTFRYESRPKYSKWSASGSALAVLREQGLFHGYLASLGSRPHTVTKLDAALDLRVDAAPVVAGLHARYPIDCALLRKALPTRVLLAARRDGVQSGTFYAGHRKKGQEKACARVYDKQLEVWEHQGLEIPPTVRYEVTARRELGVTLRDAAYPAGVFWYLASPALLERMDPVKWSPGEGMGWVAPHADIPAVPWDVLRRRVEGSAELASMRQLADRCGPEGRRRLLRLVAHQLGLDDAMVPTVAGDASPRDARAPQAA
jgi:hypothetical protein